MLTASIIHLWLLNYRQQSRHCPGMLVKNKIWLFLLTREIALCQLPVWHPVYIVEFVFSQTLYRKHLHWRYYTHSSSIQHGTIVSLVKKRNSIVATNTGDMTRCVNPGRTSCIDVSHEMISNGPVQKTLRFGCKKVKNAFSASRAKNGRTSRPRHYVNKEITNQGASKFI